MHVVDNLAILPDGKEARHFRKCYSRLDGRYLCLQQ